MMTRKEKMLWALYGMILVLLFLLSSTNLIIKEKETQIYGVSVIIEDTSDDNYVNFRKGMDRAAMEFHADVSFITLYDKGSRKQQEELILREQQDGCRALIVSPVDGEAILGMQTEKGLNVPLVLLNSETGTGGDGPIGRIGFDYYHMGQELAAQIIRDQKGKRVYLFGERNPDEVSRRFRDGVLSVLEPAGYEIVEQEGGNAGEWKKAAGEVARKDGVRAVIAALDPVCLAEVAQALSEPGMAPGIGGLYGRGTTVRLLNYLDRGVIQGLCVTDDFSAGYLSVKMAVELAGNQTAEALGYLESRFIRQEDLRNLEYEKMLYPIE
ncbi:MAG: substrate-binding domain-containing protein [Lachnospiraceae bacterium]|nr:substrate-binding domain-containing protein [Lachnospiraceae bacterium]